MDRARAVVGGRARKMCLKCNQMLSYSAYNRHLSALVCQAPSSTCDSASQLSSESSVVTPCEVEDSGDDGGENAGDENAGSEVVEDDASVSDDSETVDSDSDEVEVIDEAEECVQESVSSESEGTANSGQPNTAAIIQYVCYVVSFFQLCYKLSDRAITLLLFFLHGLLFWISLIIPAEGSLVVNRIMDSLPRNIYFLKQYLHAENKSIKYYVVCPKCCTLITRRHFLSYQTMPLDIPKCGTKIGKGNRKCNAPLYKRVKHGSHYKIVPKSLYSYFPIKETLVKLYNRPDFHRKCELWRKRRVLDGVYTDIYDGAVWKEYLCVNGKPFLSAPYNLSLKLNVDWIQPFNHTQYSMGIIYLAVENLPRSERFKVENVLLVGCIPGPREPKHNINSFLAPMVDELLELWNGIQLKTSSSLFGYTSLRCALTCVSSDLPATRKVCGFAGHSAAMGCSKCKIKFKSGSFGEKLDYSGYDRSSWQPTDKESQMAEVSAVQNAKTNTEVAKLERKFGVRYSELLRLPYFDVVRYHCIDVMHNLLLGTAKNLLNVWLSMSVLTPRMLELVQEKVDKMEHQLALEEFLRRLVQSDHLLLLISGETGYVSTHCMLCMESSLPLIMGV